MSCVKSTQALAPSHQQQATPSEFRAYVPAFAGDGHNVSAVRDDACDECDGGWDDDEDSSWNICNNVS